MGETPDEARQAVVATRERVDQTLNRLEARLRMELNPSVRLHRDGPKLALALVVVALAGGVYIVRARRRRARLSDEQDWISGMPEEWKERLQRLLAEAAANGRVPMQTESAGHRPAWQGLALRGARIAAPMVFNAAAQRLAQRQQPSIPGRGAGSPHS